MEGPVGREQEFITTYLIGKMKDRDQTEDYLKNIVDPVRVFQDFHTPTCYSEPLR